jgi:hypothetical protein
MRKSLIGMLAISCLPLFAFGSEDRPVDEQQSPFVTLQEQFKVAQPMQLSQFSDDASSTLKPWFCTNNVTKDFKRTQLKTMKPYFYVKAQARIATVGNEVGHPLEPSVGPDFPTIPAKSAQPIIYQFQTVVYQRSLGSTPMSPTQLGYIWQAVQHNSIMTSPGVVEQVGDAVQGDDPIKMEYRLLDGVMLIRLSDKDSDFLDAANQADGLTAYRYCWQK